VHKRLFLTPQFLVFVAGGGLSALIDIGLMQLLIVNHAAPILAASCGFFAGLVVNYVFHAAVTFKNPATVSTFLRFMCVVGLNYLITLAFVSASLALIDNALWGKLMSLPVVAANGFLLSKMWIFK
jgi:putative flippase GtrA